MPKPPIHPIQDEQESTVGKKPERFHADERAPDAREAPRGATRSGAALRREEGDETEAQGEIRDRERDDPPTITGLAE
jgi:hypothetical protein